MTMKYTNSFLFIVIFFFIVKKVNIFYFIYLKKIKNIKKNFEEKKYNYNNSLEPLVPIVISSTFFLSTGGYPLE